MSNWLDKIMPSKIRSESKQRTGVPEGLWKKCPKCGAFLYKPELEKNLDVCPKMQSPPEGDGPPSSVRFS